MMKITYKTQNDVYVEVYRRILKYPPFTPGRAGGVMHIKHQLTDGYIEATAPEHVTTEDAEKMFVCIVLAKEKRSEEKTITTSCHIADVRKIINCNDDKYIERALKRTAKLTLSMHFSKKTIVTHIIHYVELDYATGIITIVWDRLIYDACKTKALTLNLSLYIRLTPVAKNLYSFLIANQGREFYEDTVVERCVIKAKRKDKAQEMLKKALNELVLSTK